MPRVIGEIAGGFVLGPSVLGLVSLDAHKWLFAGFAAQGACFRSSIGSASCC